MILSIASSAIQKEARKDTYTKGRNEKDLKIQTLQAQLQGLGGAAPMPFVLMPGTHTLLLELPNKIELCRLNVIPADSPSQSKPPHP